MNPRIILLFLIVLAAAGCGASQGGLTGTVTHRGRPVGYGTVVVIAADGLPYHGEIQPDGRYEIAGVGTGVATVCVTSPPPPGAENHPPARTAKETRKAEAMRNERGDEETAPVAPQVVRNWQPIPDRYSDPAVSPLRFTIKGGSNAVDISLD